YDLNQLTESLERPHEESFSNKREWLTVSKALARSRKTAAVTKPLSMLAKVVSVKCASAISVENLGLKPNCGGESISLSIR
ncbi:Hypothetical predicted protein, partial [Paramuricea clavata]